MMFKRTQWPLLASLFVLFGCAEPTGSGDEVQSRTFAILAINDVYRIEGLQSGQGGLARVRTLRKQLEEQYPDLLVMHGGDLLFPSLLSRQYKGEQMISVLNSLDGPEAGFDPRMFVVFGNHEFDEESSGDFPVFKARVESSDFNWLSTNVRLNAGYEITSGNMADNFIVESGGVKVGIFGLTIRRDDVEYASVGGSLEDFKRVAVEQTELLRGEGAEYVIALTHLELDDDREILRLSNGPDMVIGGHDHAAVDELINDRCLLKADADAITARVTTVTLGSGPEPVVQTELRALAPDTYAEDVTVDALVDDWLARHVQDFCESDTDCLAEPLARTHTRLVGEELTIRGQESNLGNWVADQMLGAAVASGRVPDDAQAIAIINSGALRLNQNVEAGATITARVLEELIQYNDPLYLLPVTTEELRVALNHAVSQIGEGPWLQISGFEYKADLMARAAADIVVGGVPIDELEGELYVVMPRYIATPDAGDQDRYSFRGNDSHSLEIRLKDVVREGLEEAPDGVIAPRIEGRIEIVNDGGEADVARCGAD